VQYTANNVPVMALSNFSSLKTIYPALKGIALFDNIQIQPNVKLNIICWRKRELENYFAKPNILIKWAKLQVLKYPDINAAILGQKMEDAIKSFTPPAYLKDLTNIWWDTEKLSDNWLDKIFSEFYKSIKFPPGFYKRDYYQLIMLLSSEEIDGEIKEKLDLIFDTIK